MSRAIDLTRKEFGKLIVIARCGSNKCGQALWLCKCACGNETIVPGSYLRSGHTTSCGCIREREDLTDKIFGKLDSILSLLEYYIPALQNRQLCLDTGVLVGELTPPINKELARIETSRERGR